jgi:hypothetical protein
VLQPLDQARSLISEIAAGGIKSPGAFSKLLNLILSSIVAGEHDQLKCSKVYERHARDPKTVNEWIIEPVEGVKPLKLNDGNFLLIHYLVELDDHQKLSVIKSKVQYQLSSDPDQWREIFRYEFNRPEIVLAAICL